jgi:hypothetical protein
LWEKADPLGRLTVMLSRGSKNKSTLQGDFLFVIESGGLEAKKNDQVVHTFQPAEVFGEL